MQAKHTKISTPTTPSNDQQPHFISPILATQKNKRAEWTRDDTMPEGTRAFVFDFEAFTVTKATEIPVTSLSTVMNLLIDI